MADGGALAQCTRNRSSEAFNAHLQKAILEAAHHAWNIPLDANPNRAPVRIVPMAHHASPTEWDIILVDIQWHWPALSCEHAYATGQFPIADYELHDPPLLAAAIGTFMAPFSRRWQTHTGGECTVVSGHRDHPFLVQTIDTQLRNYFPNPFLDRADAILATQTLDRSTIDYLIGEIGRALPASLLRDGTMQASGEPNMKGRL